MIDTFWSSQLAIEVTYINDANKRIVSLLPKAFELGTKVQWITNDVPLTGVVLGWKEQSLIVDVSNKNEYPVLVLIKFTDATVVAKEETNE